MGRQCALRRSLEVASSPPATSRPPAARPDAIRLGNSPPASNRGRSSEPPHLPKNEMRPGVCRRGDGGAAQPTRRMRGSRGRPLRSSRLVVETGGMRSSSSRRRVVNDSSPSMLLLCGVEYNLADAASRPIKPAQKPHHSTLHDRAHPPAADHPSTARARHTSCSGPFPPTLHRSPFLISQPHKAHRTIP